MTEHHPNCEDATGAYPGSCTCKTIAMDNLIAQDADLIDNPLAAAVRELLTDDSMEHLDTFTHNLVQAFDRHGLKAVSTDYLDNLHDTVRGLRQDIKAEQKHTDTSRSGDLVAKLRDEDSYYRLQEKHWCIDAEELERQRLAAADRIEALSAENERLRDTPNHIWAEARDSEWDEGFNYAVKLFRAALGEKQ